MSEERDQYIRQSGIVNRAKLAEEKVVMVGAGGIGSVAATFLTKMGVENMKVFDFDDVELHNIPNQMYPLDSVGQPKVDALSQHVKQMGGVDIETINDIFSDEHEVEGIVISAVDSMAARKEIWNSIKRNPKVNYFIDGRMGGWVCVRLAIDMASREDMKYFESTLFDDADAQPLPCTERAIIFNTGSIGAMIASTIAKRVQGHEIDRHLVYDLMNDTILKLHE